MAKRRATKKPDRAAPRTRAKQRATSGPRRQRVQGAQRKAPPSVRGERIGSEVTFAALTPLLSMVVLIVGGLLYFTIWDPPTPRGPAALTSELESRLIIVLDRVAAIERRLSSVEGSINAH